MGRKKITAIEKELEDAVVEQYLSLKPEAYIKQVPKQRKVASAVSKVIRMAESLYRKEGSKSLDTIGLYDLQQAYDYLRERGYSISFRAFGGRIERGSIPSVKVGRKRYIAQQILDHLVSLNEKYYTIREAYDMYRKYEPKINYRAFIGRIEKGAILSVKIGGKRFIPREVLDSLVHIEKNYYTVTEAINELSKNGVKINRNAFERRLDRGRIPHYKIGGRRFIPKEVFQEVLNREMERRR